MIYTIAEANYGGRVTDPMDRRLIKVLLKSFIGPHVLNEDFKFSNSDLYIAPEDGDLKYYINYI